MLVDVDKHGPFKLRHEFAEAYRDRPVPWGFGPLSWVAYKRSYSRSGEEWWQTCKRVIDAPRTVVEEFAKIKSGDVVLPTVTREGRPGKTVHVRCVTTPDHAQRVLLNRLGLALPQRLRYLEQVAPM